MDEHVLVYPEGGDAQMNAYDSAILNLMLFAIGGLFLFFVMKMYVSFKNFYKNKGVKTTWYVRRRLRKR